MPKNIVEMINALNTQHKYAIADAVNSIETSSGARNAITDAIHNIEMSGGDGGIFEIETGEWTPENDVAKTTISFSKRHDKMPVLIIFQCVEEEEKTTLNTQWQMCYIDYYQLFNSTIPRTGSINLYGNVHGVYRGKFATSLYSSSFDLTAPSSDKRSSDTSCARFFTSENEFYPNTGVTSGRYWKSGFQHKWIALWLK